MKKYALIGAPDDRGVAINNGRPGAAGGPDAIREALRKRVETSQKKFTGVSFKDMGNIDVNSSQEETYRLLSEKTAALHKKGFTVIVLGGGHDLSLGSLDGFHKVFPSGGVVNVDPHLDVRERTPNGDYSSGTPFRNLLETSQLPGKQLMEFGYTSVNAEEHVRYAKEKGVFLVPSPGDFEKNLKPFALEFEKLAVSFDLDSINGSDAPGVSALNKNGYSAEEALRLVREIKGLGNVCHFELMEMNPQVDHGSQTATLAARLLLAFLVD